MGGGCNEWMPDWPLCVCRDRLVSLVQLESQERKDEGWGLCWPSNCFTVSHLSRAVVTLCNYMFAMQGPAGPQGTVGQRGPNVSTAKWVLLYTLLFFCLCKVVVVQRWAIALHRQTFIFHLQLRNEYKTYQTCLFTHRESGGNEEQRDPLESQEKR